jgi:hypothetical protein
MGSRTRCGSPILVRGPPLACDVEDPPRAGDHGRWCGTRPMEPDDQQVVRQCTRPTRFQLNLKVVGPHIESSETLYSAAAQTWTLLCGASCPPSGGLSSRQRLVGESPRNPSTKNPDLDVRVVDGLPNDASHSP